jgi:RNA polymerase sigma-70 factor (ECF subfamily)
MIERDDTTLLLAAGRGDRRAFGELVERHHRAIVQFVHRFLAIADRATAEDLAQEVFLAAWTAAPSFKPRAAVRTWLFRIATNRCLNHKRSKRRKPTVPLTGEPMPRSSGAGAETSDRMLEQETAARLAAALEMLPASQRAAVILRHQHELSTAEVAAVLETSISAVDALLFRARARLRELLSADEKD